MNSATAASLPIGIAHFTTIDVEPTTLVAMAAKIGYAAVGLRLHPAFPGAPFYEIPAGGARMRAMRALLNDTGLSVYDIEFVAVDPTFDVAALQPVLDSAAELGAKRISICGDDPDPTRFAESLAGLCDAASGVGLGVDLEIMPWRAISTLALALDAVRRAERDNAGILVDALHLSRSGGSPADLRTAPEDMIRSAQLCDAVAQRPTATDALVQEARSGRLPPGEGALPLHALLAHLPDHAALSVEVPNTGHPPEEHASRVYDAARRVLAAYATAERP